VRPCALQLLSRFVQRVPHGSGLYAAMYAWLLGGDTLLLRQLQRGLPCPRCSRPAGATSRGTAALLADQHQLCRLVGRSALGVDLPDLGDLLADLAQRATVCARAPVRSRDFLATRTFIIVVVNVSLATSLGTCRVVRGNSGHRHAPFSPRVACGHRTDEAQGISRRVASHSDRPSVLAVRMALRLRRAPTKYRRVERTLDALSSSRGRHVQSSGVALLATIRRLGP
jgi:hypothetical protein